MSSVDSKHPDYVDREEDWRTMRHTNRGSKAVKDQTVLYLPKPSGFLAQPDGGSEMYSAYQMRAEFPELVTFTLNGMVGMVHKQEANIEMPDSMQYLWEKSTKKGLTLEALHRRLTAELILTGRYALLADAPQEGGDPFLAGYKAEALINWSEFSDFFVLDESGLVQNEFDWVEQKQHRVLRLRDGQYTQRIYRELEASGTEFEPIGRGNKKLTEIPLVVIGARDLHVDPDEAPLIGVARSSLAIYRLDADYRHQLFMSGQETLFIIGVDEATKLPTHVGAGIVQGLPLGADAKYVGPNAKGIEAHERAISNERKAASEAGARLFDKEPKQRVSGEALKTRYNAENATLASVALTSAAGLERALRYIATMLGADPDKVVVKPNLDFVDTTLDPQQAINLVSMWQNEGISWETLQENLHRGGIASEERTAEEERALIKANPPPKKPLPGTGDAGNLPPDPGNKKDPIAKPPVKAI
jgi:hypothetical protein